MGIQTCIIVVRGKTSKKSPKSNLANFRIMGCVVFYIYSPKESFRTHRDGPLGLSGSPHLGLFFKFILLFSIKVSRFLPTISRFLVLLRKDGYAIQIFPIILNMGCVVPYVYREYEKNGQSFFVPFSIKVPRFMPTISRFFFFTRECELWWEIQNISISH